MQLYITNLYAFMLMPTKQMMWEQASYYDYLCFYQVGTKTFVQKAVSQALRMVQWRHTHFFLLGLNILFPISLGAKYF